MGEIINSWHSIQKLMGEELRPKENAFGR
jgi:hypothetical protein